MNPATDYEHAHAAAAQDLAELGADTVICPECETHLSVPHNADRHIVFCPRCGQCVAVPVPWTLAVTEWGWSRPYWPYTSEKYHGSVGICVGLVLGAVWLLPISLYLRSAAVFLGGSLFVEGLGRLWTDVHRDQSPRRAGRFLPPAAMPESANQFGELKAVYPTSNSWLESLALCLLGLALASGGAWMLDWLLQGMFHPKLLLGAVFAPAALLYLLYRSARNLADRRVILIFSEGLACIRRRRCDVYPCDAIKSISTENIGDCIDEHAVRITLTPGRAPLRFTRCQFANLELLWQRLVQEFNPPQSPPADMPTWKPRSGGIV